MDARPEAALANRPFRTYPTTLRLQRRVASDADACQRCVAGVCCASEDPISLTAFDLLRLSAHFDLAPGEFMRRFTQDRFEVDDNPDGRAAAMNHPESSVVTWLRRRTNSVFSPCIFLKYIRGQDGVARRICSVHPARPLACREYYFNTCKTRWTGELAALTAHAHESARDLRVTPEQAEVAFRDACAAVESQPRSAIALLRRFYWSEVRRALRLEECNEDGAAAFDIERWQDPLAEKLNRLLSRKHLRFEERYGPEPWGDQLHPYAAGNAFASSADRERLLRLVSTPPATDLFADGDYPLRVAHRDWLPGALSSGVFPEMSAAAMARETQGLAPEAVEITRGILRGMNALARMAGSLHALGHLLELERPGALEAWILAGCRRLRRRSCAARRHPALALLLEWSRARAQRTGAAREALRSLRALPAPPRSGRALLAAQDAAGGWGPHPEDRRRLPPLQSDYTKARLWQTLSALEQLSRLDARP